MTAGVYSENKMAWRFKQNAIRKKRGVITAIQNDRLTVICGDALESLRQLPDESVQCCVTSPPYWGLRDYGTAKWDGGDATCDHKQGRPGAGRADGIIDERSQRNRDGIGSMGGDCAKCGAIRIDSQLGLEKTPEEYMAKMVAVFREVRRVLKSDGTLWLNLGDSYAGSWGAQSRDNGNDNGSTLQGGSMLSARQIKAHPKWQTGTGSVKNTPGLKAKDLVGIPWAIARALRDPFYSGRVMAERDRVWLAAILDAEGCICGFDHDRADGNGHRSGVHITITNTSEALLDEAARIWPASRSEHEKHHGGHLGNKPSWRWIAHGIENKMAFLREIYPHLIAKRKQAIAAYSLLILMADAKRLGHSPQKDAVTAKRAVLTKLLSDLNQQLNPVMPDWLTEPPSLFSDGWWLRQDIIWSKPNPMPESVTDRCTKAHEYLFLLTKSARYYYDAEAIKEQVAYSSIERLSQDVENQLGSDRVPGKSNGTMKAVGARSARDSFKRNGSKREQVIPGQSMGTHRPNREESTWDLATRNKRSVWTVTTQPFRDAHFATFPPDLIKPCILAGSKAGDVILDPFAGSGTTGMVALELGRKAMLIELNPEYCDLIKKRCDVTPGLCL